MEDVITISRFEIEVNKNKYLEIRINQLIKNYKNRKDKLEKLIEGLNDGKWSTVEQKRMLCIYSEIIINLEGLI